MVLENLKKSLGLDRETRLKQQLVKSRSFERDVRIERELSEIQQKKRFEAEARRRQREAFESEKLKQAAVVGQQRARFEAQQQIKAIKSGQTKKRGALAGFDKFLAGTGVARGTAPVIRKGGSSFDPMKPSLLGGSSYNPITGTRKGKKKGGFSVI